MNNQLDENDLDFFDAFADLLEKFPQQKGRFNLRLDHEHFPISKDEFLIENHDADKRILKTKVIPRSELVDGAFEVEWRIQRKSDGLHVQTVQVCCGEDGHTHPTTHTKEL